MRTIPRDAAQRELSPSRTAPHEPAGFAGAAARGALRSPGLPLDSETRGYFEPRLGHDFSRVRVHTDARAAASAKTLSADAYTLGSDIVFGAGRYAPNSKSGKELLAHELTHVRQQPGSAGDFSKLRVGPTDDACEREAGAAAKGLDSVAPSGPSRAQAGAKAEAGVIQRSPGENARESWDALVTVTLPQEEGARGRAEEAISRFLRIPSGVQLINGLWRHFCAQGACRSGITVSFVESLGEGAHDAGGIFEPPNAGAARYTVRVLNQAPRPSSSRSISMGGAWPGGTGFDIQFTHTEPESRMAETLHHEILHVWFVNTQQGAQFPTGHGDVMRGQIEPVFLARVRSAMGEIDALETQIRAERRAAAEAPPPSPTQPRRTEPSPAVAQPQPGRPSLFGGEISLHGGGGMAGRAGAGAGILGADLVLNSIYSLRLGARGVYLTPDHLFAGGSVGLRLLQGPDGITTGSRVQNPLFFDVEAGILAEIPLPTATRLTTGVAGFGAAGFGQEYGVEGPRFFWRLGGFVMIGDRTAAPGATGPAASPGVGAVGGGGTGGVGLRF